MRTDRAGKSEVPGADAGHLHLPGRGLVGAGGARAGRSHAAVHTTALGGGLSHLIGACVIRLRDMYATPGGAAVAALGLTLTGAMLARTAFTTITHLRAVRQQTLRHAQTARMVGRPEPALGATLVDHPQPAAYCVAGPQPTVVLTTGALLALDPA